MTLRLLKPTREADPELVAFLEQLVTEAKEGKFAALAMVIEYDDDQVAQVAFHGNRSSPVRMIGELEMLKSTMVLAEMDRRSED